MTGVGFTTKTFRIDVRSPNQLISTDGLLEAEVPDGPDVVLDTTYGEEIAVGATGRR